MATKSKASLREDLAWEYVCHQPGLVLRLQRRPQKDPSKRTNGKEIESCPLRGWQGKRKAALPTPN
jgi:hypothetical protein